MRLADWKAKGKIFDHYGQNIFYVDEGEGPTVLCIHGFPTASWDWHAVWPALIERFRVIAPDMIGFGWSAKPTQYAYAIFDQANLHEKLLKILNVRSFHVLAHDYGVSVAQELLARRIERNREERDALEMLSVCFLNGGLFPEMHRPLFIQKILASPVGFLATQLLNEKTFRRNFVKIFGDQTQPSDQELRDFWTLITHNDGSRIYHKLIGYIADRKRWRTRWVDALGSSPIPLRLINGLTDPVSGAHVASYYRRNVPHPDVVELPGIGHYPQVEAPEKVVKAFFEFADRV